MVDKGMLNMADVAVSDGPIKFLAHGLSARRCRWVLSKHFTISCVTLCQRPHKDIYDSIEQGTEIRLSGRDARCVQDMIALRGDGTPRQPSLLSGY